MKAIRIDIKNTISEENFSRKDVLREFRLRNRDLRPIFLLNQVPTLLVREDSIIVNLERVKMIIGSKKALIFNINIKDISEDFIALIEKKLDFAKEEKTFFEFALFEAACEHAVENLREKFESISVQVESVLKKISTEFDQNSFEKLLHVKNKLNSVHTISEEMQNALLEMIEDETEQQAMYLTLQAKKQEVLLDELDEIESILDNYFEEIEDITHQIEELQDKIESTQEIITLKLSSLRNTIIRVDLVVTIISAFFGAGAVVTGLFGMNLDNKIESHPEAFLTIAIILGSITVVGMMLTIWIFRKRKIL